MTARDTTTESDPTDEVAADQVATPDAAEGDTGEPSAAAERPDLTKRSDAGKRSDPAERPDLAKRAAAEDDPDPDAADDTTAEAATDSAAPATEKRRGRRRRHAADDDGQDDAPDAEDGDARGRSRSARRRPATASTRRRRRWPLVALVLVTALFAGAMVVLWSATRPAPIAGLSGSQQAALDAASQAAVNLQTFRRASFDEDFANALASLTPEYGQQQFADRKDELQKQLTAGARDASATVQSAGLVSSTASTAVVLVVTTTVQTADDGTSTPFVFSRLQLSMQLIDGKWLVNDLKSVGLS